MPQAAHAPMQACVLPFISSGVNLCRTYGICQSYLPMNLSGILVLLKLEQAFLQNDHWPTMSCKTLQHQGLVLSNQCN